MWGVKKSIWATNPCNCQHKLNKDLSQILCPQTEHIPNMTSHGTLLFYKQRHKQPHWYWMVSPFTGHGSLCQITRIHVHIGLLYKLKCIFFLNYLKKELFWNMRWPQLSCRTEHCWLCPVVCSYVNVPNGFMVLEWKQRCCSNKCKLSVYSVMSDKGCQNFW